MPLDLGELWVGDVAGVQLTTSIDAHLTMRYTYTEPVKTSIPKEKRGAHWYYDNKMCFVAFKECPQDEPGDTLTHTFSCPIFPYCVPVWYYFSGTRGGAPSPSNTAIFEAHLTWPTPPVCNMPAPSKTIVGVEGIALPLPLGAPPKTLVGVEGIAKAPALNTPTKTLTT